MGKKLIGFDFGESRMKAVLYDGNRVKKTVFADVPEEIMQDGNIVKPDAMANFIAETAKEYRLGRGDAAFILPSAGVYTKICNIPVMTNRQALYNLPYEFSDYLVEEKDSYYFDYMVLGTEKGESGNEEMRVFACATLKSVISDYRNMFKRAGFKLKVAVPTEYAYSRIIGRYLSDSGINDETDCCIVDVGHTETRVFIFHGSEFVQRRNIEFGMRGLTKLIAEKLEIDSPDAEERKRENRNGVLDSDYCSEYFDSLAVEVMKTVNFYNYNNRDAELGNIYLTGGGAALPAVSSKIAYMTGLDIKSAGIFLPSDGSEENKELFVLACGGAI